MIVVAMAASVSRTPKRTSSAKHNLPAPLTSLVGRERELKGLGEAFRRARLVTLSGPGGVGKTRLALELARDQAPKRADGVWMVDLAASPGEPDVPAETARVLDIRTPRGRTATDVLREFLADRDLLLVLDNCEHVVEPCAQLANALLTSCPNLRIVATSREVLAVSGERVWRLDPLEPEDARRLLVERARQRRPEFMPGERDDATLDRICERVDRLPLGIELAAARVGMMSPEEILSGLERQLGSLSGGGRLAPPRHRTVRGTVGWSHELLDADEQAALRSLAVFVGGFDAAAAIAVAPGLSIEMLARLADKSLVSVVESPRGRTRYRLLETVREYEHELLVQAGELEAARDRHLRHFSGRADRESDSWPSLSAGQLLADLHDDYENVRAALEWAAVADPCTGMALFVCTWELFQMLGQADGVRLAELLLEACPDRNRTRALVQISLGGLRMMLVDPEGVRAAEEDARQLSAELGERGLEGWARLFQGLAATLGGAVDPGREALTEARDLLREAGARSGEGKAIAALGLVEMLTGEPERGKELVEEALEIQIATGDRWSQGQCHTYLGMIAEASGADPSRATHHYRQAVEALRPFRDATLLPAALAFQGGVLGRRDPKRSLKVVAGASAIRARAGGQFPPVFRERVDNARSEAEVVLGPEAEAMWREGTRLGVDEAVALAFGTATPRPLSPAGLSAREVEVVRLVADGLSNKAIASQLHLSVRTVESHVRHALAKVGLENRTRLATWARERIQ
jgi:predicted ATPase/DNA-binding CsgD family transcriptional regulator